MPRHEKVMSVFVASPSDVGDERAKLEEVIREINETRSRELGLRLELVRWETHAFPDISDDAQAVINEQIPDDYDLFIGIMWQRYGTATGRAGSGTVEEFERAKARFDADNNAVKIMFYFKDDPIPPSQIDTEQIAKVNDFKNRLGDEGSLYWKFVGLREFERLVRIHLTRQIQRWTSATRDSFIESEHDYPSSETEPQENHDDIGILDLADIFEDRFAELTDITERITTASEDLTTKMQSETEELNNLPRDSSGNADRKTVKKYIVRAAAGMDQFSSRLEAELPLYNDAMNSGLNAFMKTVEISSEMDNDEDAIESAEESLAAIRNLRESLRSGKDSQDTFRQSIVDLPRMTSVLNKSKRRAVSAMDRFIAEFETGIKLLDEVEKTVVDFIDQQKSEIGKYRDRE